MMSVRSAGSSPALVTRGIVCVGASAGGLEALHALVASLPADLPASLFVVLHVSPAFPSTLPAMLSRWGPLPAAHAAHGETIRPGRIYVAPPDRHLLIEGPTVSVVFGPKENHARPAIDPLFRSAAQCCGPRSVGVILSGNLADGTAGLWAIRRAGGVAMVQDPREAFVSAMPENAMAYVKPDYILNAGEMGAVLAELAVQRVKNSRRKLDPVMAMESLSIHTHPLSAAQMTVLGRPTMYICPECNGPMWQVRGGPPRLRCHEGHAYSGRDFIGRHDEKKEGVLWAAVRLLDEQTSLLREQSRIGRYTTVQQKELQENARHSEAGASHIRKILQRD